jgi:hypothetical protein
MANVKGDPEGEAKIQKDIESAISQIEMELEEKLQVRKSELEVQIAALEHTRRVGGEAKEELERLKEQRDRVFNEHMLSMESFRKERESAENEIKGRIERLNAEHERQRLELDVTINGLMKIKEHLSAELEQMLAQNVKGEYRVDESLGQESILKEKGLPNNVIASFKAALRAQLLSNLNRIVLHNRDHWEQNGVSIIVDADVIDVAVQRWLMLKIGYSINMILSADISTPSGHNASVTVDSVIDFKGGVLEFPPQSVSIESFMNRVATRSQELADSEAYLPRTRILPLLAERAGATAFLQKSCQSVISTSTTAEPKLLPEPE